jgi:hypothetical protein
MKYTFPITLFPSLPTWQRTVTAWFIQYCSYFFAIVLHLTILPVTPNVLQRYSMKCLDDNTSERTREKNAMTQFKYLIVDFAWKDTGEPRRTSEYSIYHSIFESSGPEYKTSFTTLTTVRGTESRTATHASQREDSRPYFLKRVSSPSKF